MTAVETSSRMRSAVLMTRSMVIWALKRGILCCC
jgi:hypothetical protein